VGAWSWAPDEALCCQRGRLSGLCFYPSVKAISERRFGQRTDGESGFSAPRGLSDPVRAAPREHGRCLRDALPRETGLQRIGTANR
jgi:hypothetical protein